MGDKKRLFTFNKSKTPKEKSIDKTEKPSKEESNKKVGVTESVKNYASDKFIAAVEKEKAHTKKLEFWSIVYEVITMLFYTVMTIISVFTKWSEADNPLLMAFLLLLYIGSFVVMTAYYVKSAKSEEMSYDKKKATVKNYKSVSLIIKKVMKVISLGISVLLAVESWNDGLVFKIIGLVLIALSVIAFIKTLVGIFKEVKKMKKRTEEPKTSKGRAVKKKIEDYSDSLKEKREAEKKK